MSFIYFLSFLYCSQGSKGPRTTQVEDYWMRFVSVCITINAAELLHGSKTSCLKVAQVPKEAPFDCED